MKKNIFLLLLILALTVWTAGCDKFNNDTAGDKVIGEVNGAEITQAEFDQHYKVLTVSYELQGWGKLDEVEDAELIDDIKTQAFDDLVMQKLVVQDVIEKGLVVDQAKIDENIDYIKSAYDQQSAGGFNKFLQDNGLTEAMLRDEITSEQNYQALYDEVTKDTVVTEDDIERYYNDNQEEFASESGIHIYHILVEEEELAQDIISRLKQGEDFDQLAAENSIDTSNKDIGGDLGLVNEYTNFVEEFLTAALNMNPNQLLETPVESQFGFHIIRSGEKIEAELAPLSEVEEHIRLDLVNNKKNNTFTWYLDDMRQNAEVNDLR